MDLHYFLSILSKRKLLLLVVALSAAIATWFLVGFLPKTYKSSASIATGLTEPKSIRVGEQNVFVQEFEIQTKFNNFMEYMKSRPSLDRLIRRLMLHDFDSQQTAFRTLKEKDKQQISTQEIEKYITILKTDSLYNFATENLEYVQIARKLEKAMGYDYESLLKNFDIKRTAESDNLRVEFKSEDAKLSYFVVKTFCDDFLAYYYRDRNLNTDSSLIFYRQVVAAKRDSLEHVMNRIYAYSSTEGVVSIKDQSQTIVTQIKDVQTALDEEQKKLNANKKILEVYNAEKAILTPRQIEDYNNALQNNKEVRALDNEINRLRGVWVDNGARKDDPILTQITTLKAQQSELARKIATAIRPQRDVIDDKEKEVYMKRLDAESNARASQLTVQVYDDRLGRLNGELKKLVKNNAQMDKLTQQLSIAQDEYKAAAEKLSLAEVNKQSTIKETPVRVVEPPLPADKPEKSGRAMLAIFAGVGGVTIAVIILFLIAYFDASLKNPTQVQKMVGLPLIGIINRLPQKSLSQFNQFFISDTSHDKEATFFKESLRKLRHEIEMSKGRTFLFMSLKDREGKSFVVAALSHALTLKNKKVLLIDMNFKNNTLTLLTSPSMPKNTVNNSIANTNLPISTPNGTDLGFQISLPDVDIIGNKGGHQSPSELLAGVDFMRKIEYFKTQYDYIFFEVAALNKYSDTRELVPYVEKIVPILDATTHISSKDTEGIEFMSRLNGKMLGAILNKADLQQLS